MNARLGVVGGIGLVLFGCGMSSPSRSGGSGGTAAPEAGLGSGGVSPGAGGAGSGGSSTGGASTGGATTGTTGGPVNLVKSDVGGYEVGAAITGSGFPNTGVQPRPGGAGCGVLVGVIRDFQGAGEPSPDPDFDVAFGRTPTAGLVKGDLGLDGKPAYTGICQTGQGANPACANGVMTSTQANFDEWFRYTVNVNEPFVLYLALAPNGAVSTFQSNAFYPLGTEGWGIPPGETHDTGFTTEFHVKFEYRQGQTFTFTGMDDVWVFLNGRLAIDLGGTHPSATQKIALDDLANDFGLTLGSEYRLDLFHSNRDTFNSVYRIDTNIPFTDCGALPPDTGN